MDVWQVFRYMKKLNRTALKNKCDKLFSLKIRSKGYCELRETDGISCGGPLQCAHIDTRGKHAIRWNEMNALCLCAGHHWYYTNNPNKWYEIISSIFPEKYMFYLKHQSDIWDKDLEKVYNELCP